MDGSQRVVAEIAARSPSQPSLCTTLPGSTDSSTKGIKVVTEASGTGSMRCRRPALLFDGNGNQGFVLRLPAGSAILKDDYSASSRSGIVL